MRVEVFIDYVCPYCFLVEGAVRALEADRDVQIVVRPFELRPDPVPTLRPEDSYLPLVWHDSVYPMAKKLGIGIKLPTISPQPRTAKAFTVLEYAQESGLAREYSDGVFQAFFQADRDIGDDDVIVDIAAQAGLDAAKARAALSSDKYRERQAQAQSFAAEHVGIRAVPSFIVNGQLFSGVPDAEQLKAAFDAAAGIRGNLPDLRRHHGPE